MSFTGADRDVKLSIEIGKITDINGNSNVTAFSKTIAFDNAAPVYQSVLPAEGALNSIPSITLTFNEPTNLNANLITVSGATKGTTSNSGNTTTLTLSGQTQGEIKVTCAAGAFVDAAGNTSTTTTTFTYTYDAVLPTLTDYTPKAYNTNPDTIIFTYSEDITVDNNKITVVGATPSTSQDLSNKKSFTLTLSNIIADPITITLDSGAVKDQAGNAAAIFNKNLPQDIVLPTIKSLTPATVTTNQGTIQFTFTPSETCTINRSMITVTGGDSAKDIINLLPSAGNWIFTVTNITGDRTVTLGAGVLTDSAGNTNSAPLSATITFDNTLPVLSFLAQDFSPLSGNSIADSSFVINSSEDLSAGIVSNAIALNAIALNADGSDGAATVVTLDTPIKLTQVTIPATYRWQVPFHLADPNVQKAKFTVSLNAAAGTDIAGNTSAAVAATTFTANYAPPTLSTTIPADGAQTNDLSNITLTFNVPTKVDKTKIAVVGATLGNLTGSGKAWTLGLNSPQDGKVTLTWKAGAFKNDQGFATTADSSTSFTFDSTAPLYVSHTPPQGFNGSEVSLNFTYSEPVGADLSKMTVTGATHGGVFQQSDRTKFQVVLQNITTGPVVLTLNAGAVKDDAGNSSPTKKVTLLKDIIAPTIVNASPATNKTVFTNQGTVNFALKLSEPCLIDDSRITVSTPTGKKTLTITKPMGSGTDWTFQVSGLSETRTLTIARDAIKDLANNILADDYVITLNYDVTAPVLTLRTLDGNVLSEKTTVNDNAIILDTGAEDLASIDINQITTSGLNFGKPSKTAALGPDTFGWVLPLMLKDSAVKEVSMILGPGVATDPAGNSNAAGTKISFTYNADSLKISPDSPPWAIIGNTLGSAVRTTVTILWNKKLDPNSLNLNLITFTNATLVNSPGKAPSIVGASLQLTIDGPIDSSYQVTIGFSPGAVKDLAGNPLQDTQFVSIPYDTDDPVIDRVFSASGNGPFKLGSTVIIGIDFSEPVIMPADATLKLQTGQPVDQNGQTVERRAKVVVDSKTLKAVPTGGDASKYTFSFQVIDGDNTTHLDCFDTKSFSGAITDYARRNLAPANIGDPADQTLPANTKTTSLYGTSAVVLDSTPPKITQVTSSTVDGTYSTGNLIGIQVVFSEPIVFDPGTAKPQLMLKLAPNDRPALFSRVTENANKQGVLEFLYTVQSGDSTSRLNYTDINALDLAGKDVTDKAGNVLINTALPATNDPNSLAGGKKLQVVIDTVPPTITQVKAVTDGLYGLDAVITLEVTFSEQVTITGTPQFNLDLNLPPNGSTPVYRAARFTSQSDDKTKAIFTYKVQAGDRSSKLNYPTGALLEAATGASISIVDGNNNPGNLALPSLDSAKSLGNSSSVSISTSRPTITKVAATSNIYVKGAVIPIQVTMSAPVKVTGTTKPLLHLATTPPRDAVFASLSADGLTLTFNYTVVDGDSTKDLDYTSTAALVLNNPSDIADATYGSPSIITLPALGSANSLGGSANVIVRNSSGGTVPFVTKVAGTSGTYTTGMQTNLLMIFDQPVRVTGTLRLQLNSGASGGTPPTAEYDSGSGTSTLTFRYTVGSGDKTSRLDYASSSAVFLDAGAAIDDGLLNAKLELPAPGSTNALAGTSAIVINTTVVVDPGKPAVVDGNSSSGGGCGMGGGVAILGTLGAWAWRRRQRRVA